MKKSPNTEYNDNLKNIMMMESHKSSKAHFVVSCYKVRFLVLNIWLSV